MDDYEVKVKDTSDGNKKISARGESWSELFQACAAALTETMVDMSTIDPGFDQEVELEREDPAELLFDFLTEVVLGMKEDRGFVLTAFDIEVSEDGTKLTGTVSGEELNPSKHHVHTAVSEISFDDFIAEKEDDPPEDYTDMPYMASAKLICM